jgi:hypothetical protein
LEATKNKKRSGITLYIAYGGDRVRYGPAAEGHESSPDAGNNPKIETLLTDIVTRLDRIEE